MDFHELEAFIALANTLHFAQAAAIVHLSPSALSRLLSRLEEETGAALFERDTRQVTLTREGEQFLEFAKESVYKKDDMILKLSEKDDKLHGILRVYASVTACYSILPPFVEALAREHPGLRLSVETGDPADAATAVREGRAELALDALPENGFRELDCYSVRKTPLVFVASTSGKYGKIDLVRDVPETRNPGLLAASIDRNLTRVLSSVPLILPKAGLARERFNRWIRNHGIKADIAAETSGNEAVLALARLGLGLGLVPRLVLENGPFAEGLVLYKAGPEFGEYDIGFVQKPASAGTDAARKMRAEIARIIRETCRS
jgi:LysR family transcriptional regulator, positive regulator for ilvC